MNTDIHVKFQGPGCKFNDRVKKVFPHYSNLQEYGLSEAWDLEDLIGVCKTKQVKHIYC